MALQLRHGTIEVEEQLDPAPAAPQRLGAEAGQVDEHELRWKAKVLVQQTVAGERPRRVGQQALIRLEPRRRHGLPPEEHRSLILRMVPDRNADQVVAQQLVQRAAMLRQPAKIEPQTIEAERLEGHPGREAFEHHAQAAGRPVRERPSRRDQRTHADRRRPYRDRPQLEVLRRPVAARLALHRLHFQWRVPRHAIASVHVFQWREAGNRGGREWCQRVRIERAEQACRQLRELVVQLLADARSDERERLDQPGHMRVVDRVGTQPQPPGDLRMRVGELACQVPQVSQLLVV